MSPTDGRADWDVIVIGSGAAGLTTAVVAAYQGLRTLVVEKTAWFGGTTALSGGAVWIPGNPAMHQCGPEDSREDAVAYLRHVLGNAYEPAKIEAYLDSGPEMLRFLADHSEVRFYPIPLSDYRPDAPGARIARTLITREYDGRRLGALIRHVRTPLPGFVAFGSLQTDPQHLGKFKNVLRTWEGFRFSVPRLMGFAIDLLRYGKGAHMANGNALVGRLLRSALDAGAELWRETPALRLVKVGDRITGVVVRREGRELTLKAERGVVLASGGFGGDPVLRARYMPMAEHHQSAQPETNVGDGLRIGQEAGGILPPPNADNGVWAPVSVLRHADGTVASRYPHFGPDRGKPFSLIVGPDGRRFADEAAPYQDFVNAMHDRVIGTAWFIGDRRALRRYGMGIALPAPIPFRHLVRRGYLIEAPTMAALAGKIGIDPATLVATVDNFNIHARDGVDPDFGKGGNIYDNAQGDPDHRPNPNLGPLEEPPFYAIALHPGDAGSVYGLTTTTDAEVVGADGSAIAGLYAVGLDQNTVMRGLYPGGGSGIGPAMTFAYRAARHLVRTA